VYRFQVWFECDIAFSLGFFQFSEPF